MKEYTVTIGGLEHTVLLTDEDAKARGLTGGKSADVKASEPAENKARTAPNKSK